LSYSSRPKECRSNSSLSSKSGKREVEAVASMSSQDPEDFNTWRVVEGRRVSKVPERFLKESKEQISGGTTPHSWWDQNRKEFVQAKGGEQRNSFRGRESKT